MTDAPVEASRIEERDAVSVLVLSGDWLLAQAGSLSAHLTAHGPALGKVSAVDGSALSGLDTAGALTVWSALRQAGVAAQAVELQGFGARYARIAELVRERLAETVAPARAKPLGTVARLGEQASDLGSMLAGHVSFLGLAMVELGRAISGRGQLRVRELMSQLGQTGVSALPVVALVTSLIGVVFAYLLGLQAEQYGANVFVVDGVALGMTREFSPLIVATIVAGRSGAAFTAQLGTMKLTEETDAIRTLGLSAEQVLVVPRILALMISLPLLVFIGDIAGISGAMVIAQSMLDINPHAFIERLHAALDPRHFVIGLAKAPFFALVIAVIGCRMGMDVERDTRSIGINTTSTVVQGIVAVIVLDSIFAILCQAMGL
jgi:phospholipid/cholesterol/gamma-HCH transport system permease protein